MTGAGDDLESGLELCLEKHRELSGLSSNHELLRFGDVTDRDTSFYLNKNNEFEFDRRFAKNGVHPVGVPACAYAVAQYFIALRDAVDEIRMVNPVVVETRKEPLQSDGYDGNIPF